MSPVQMELANNFAEIIKIFPKPKGALMYIQMFFRTIVREWHHLDQYRLNKFYSLIRVVMHKAFEYLASKKWKEQVVEDFLVILQEEVIVMVPNGVRYHMADIYLSEIWNATGGDINTEKFTLLLRPFIGALSGMNDKVFHRRIVKKVFEDYLLNHAAEHPRSAERPQTFPNVSTVALQEIIFDSASHEATTLGHRKVLYDLHRSYQLANKGNTVTKHTETKHAEVEPAEALTTEKKEKKKKKRKSEANVEVEVAAPVAAPVEVKTMSKKRKLSIDDTPTPEVSTPAAATLSKKLRFGKNLSKDYTKSVADLKGSSFDLRSSPAKPILSATKAPKPVKKGKSNAVGGKRAQAHDYF
jgi:hypothetical protein